MRWPEDGHRAEREVALADAGADAAGAAASRFGAVNSEFACRGGGAPSGSLGPGTGEGPGAVY
jgi:hypothetical protein